MPDATCSPTSTPGSAVVRPRADRELAYSAPAPAPRREARITIAAINGADVTLSKRLDFAHPAITDPNGAVVLRPRVANLTRNIVVRSEEQLGPGVTRGHTVDIGMGAKWDIRYNQFVGLGRTLDVPLDDTVLGTHIGTNQRGKYADHHHHASEVSVRA